MSIQRLCLCLSVLVGILFSVSAYPVNNNPTAKPKIKRVVKKSAVALKTAATVPAPPLPTPPSPAIVDDTAPSRVLNLRLHPFYLMQMLTDHETVAAGRADLDFLIADKFSFGPSFLYTNTLLPADSTGQVNQINFEYGMLFNEYLTETSSTGGIIVREHAYWVNPTGTKTDSSGNISSPTQVNSGMRAGLEVVYQKILKCGLNFEVGGGFTYHVIPYSMQFQSGSAVGPTSNFQPILSLGVGWAF